MTCIVGLVHDGNVYIGGDSCGSGGWSQVVRADQKVWTDGEFIFGFTTSFRMGQLLRYCLRVPEQTPSQSVEEYLCGPFIDGVRECLKAGGWLTIQNSSEDGGTFLLGYRGRLFKVADDFQVGERVEGWDACGVGENVAGGSLFTSEGMAPMERIETALRAAEHLSMGVRRPFVIERLEGTQS